MPSEAAPTRYQGRPLVRGTAEGPALVLEHGLSFALSFDVTEGRITDVHSGHTGERLRDRVLVMPSGRGSSSASTSFAEALRLGTGPRGIIVRDIDEILLVGAIVARRLYGTTCPIVLAEPGTYEAIAQGAWVSIVADGSFTVA